MERNVIMAPGKIIPTVRRCLSLLSYCCLVGWAGLCGCSSWTGHREPALPWGSHRPTAEQLVTYLDSQARKIQSLRCTNVDIHVQQGAQAFGATGMLAYMKPRNFRLVAHAGLQDQADIGSNDREFWFWFRHDKNNAIYRCAYEDLPHVRSLRIPIHPDWLAQALCVQEIGPAHQYRILEQNDSMIFSTQTPSPQGQPLVKTLSVATRGALAGRITAMSLRTPQGTELWSAEISEYHRDVGPYVVPRKIKVRCPMEKLEIALKLDGAQVNVLQPNNVGDTFVRPPKPGVQEIDLARAAPAIPADSTKPNALSP
ncbi:MAG: hypothetical protein RMJ82_13775 [Gemmatales bacterium]|nr:hypothetical protein [Gemmatales bacterium]